MNIDLYKEIFKRKSFHLFRDTGDLSINEDELKDIENAYNSFISLDSSIKTKIVITKDDTTCKRGQEYCILLYSEKKDNYQQNIGYLGEQLDLYLVSKNIGTLWFGIGKVEKKEIDGLEFVIMIAIKKIDNESKFRKDMYKSKRKSVSDIWHSDKLLDIANIARFAPSACNSQPWDVTIQDNILTVTRITARKGIIPKSLLSHYNRIDIGIFLCFLDLCLEKNGISYNRKQLLDDGSTNICQAAQYEIVFE